MKAGMRLLPPDKGVCQECAVAHKPQDPHDATSLYYATAFKMAHGREPTWADALAHVDDDTHAAWRAVLAKRDIDVPARTPTQERTT